MDQGFRRVRLDLFSTLTHKSNVYNRMYLDAIWRKAYLTVIEIKKRGAGDVNDPCIGQTLKRCRWLT